MKRFVLQMAGEPGTGKSTLARAVGSCTGAVVIDKDIIKSRMLDFGVPEEVAADCSYDLFFRLGESFVYQGHSIVLDSPASYSYIRERGAAIASQYDAGYFIVRCYVEDVSVMQRRLDQRVSVSSQNGVAAHDRYLRPGTSPLNEPHLILDASQSPETMLRLTLEYLGENTRR